MSRIDVRAGRLAPVVALLAGACDIDQAFLFPEPIEGVAGVQDLGLIAPVVLDSPEAVAEAIIYGEIGPTGSAVLGGLTFEFEGIGGSLCLWVDPETVFWNESVSPTQPSPIWSEPDNVFDDGDLDLTGGLSVYYTGTPGERIGGFEVRYEDRLGNNVPVDLNLCSQQDYFGTGRGHAGRGFPEFCTIPDTLVGVRYTAVLEAFSAPLDDDRLGYGLILSEGPCTAQSGFTGPNLREFMGATADVESWECVISGESIVPGSSQGDAARALELPSPTWLGVGEVPSWPRSVDAEAAFCALEAAEFCLQERERVA